VDREAYVEAAKLLETLLTTDPRPTGDDERALRYQLGRIRNLAGDPLGAAKAFDDAAALGGPLAPYARFSAADLYERAGQHTDALERLKALAADDLPITGDIELLTADALLGSGDLDGAAQRYRAYLGRSAHPARWVEVSLKFARALLNKPSEEHAEEAIRLARRVIYEGPSGAGAGEAKAIEQDALGSLPFPRRKAFEITSADALLAEAKSLAEANQSREALRVTDALIADPAAGRPGDLACGAWSVRADALGKLRKKAESADAWGTAIERCAGLDRRVDALWQGGKAAGRAGRWGDAVARYAELEKDFPAHRLADDARLKGALAARELGDEARFTAMLMRMPEDYPQGDMVSDGLFELGLSRMTKRDWAGAVLPLEKALARSPRERAYHSAGRLPYYLGRARIETGAVDQGVALLQSVVRDYPLSLYMALAYARLAERDRALAERTLDEALAREPQGDAPPPQSPAFGTTAFVRAVALARQGETRFARAELDRLGVGARTAPSEVLWAAALLFSRAGAPKEAHQLLRTATMTANPARGELVAWTEHYPAGQWRTAWELAFPRPWMQNVAAASAKSNIPESLAYAIMREESALDPRVVSGANAVGLMQLILPTARVMAKPLNLKVPDAEALKRPELNITLGCRYLGVLRGQFPDNPMLAIPGYNAGGGKPKDWVDARPNEDFDLWVEQIPYEETRLYTKRVITSMAAYDFLYGKGKAGEAFATPLAVSPAAKAQVAATP
jgi:soluble lytic murein transglycosylase